MKVDGKDIVAIVNHADTMMKMGNKQKELAKKLLTYAIIEKQKFKTDGAYVCAIGLQLFVNGC